MTRQDRIFPDLHEPAEEAQTAPAVVDHGRSAPPRFEDIFSPAPELPSPTFPKEVKRASSESAGGQRGGAPAPPKPLLDEENPFGFAGEQGAGVRQPADPRASFEQLVADILPPEEPVAEEVDTATPRGVRWRWLVVAALCLAAVVGTFIFRGRLLEFVKGGAGTGREVATPPPAAETGAATHVGSDSAAVSEAVAPVPEPTELPATPSLVAVDPASLPPATRIRSLRWEPTSEGGKLVLQADGGVVPARMRRLRLADPPRELLRISGIQAAVEPEVLAIGGPLVVRVRCGYHAELAPPELHVVLDLAAETVQVEAPQSAGDTIVVAVR